MSDKKGILTKEQEKAIAKFLDEKIKFSNPLLEALDGAVFSGVVTLIDDYGLDAINAVYKPSLEDMANCLIDKDYEGAAMAAITLLDIVVDIPGMTDTQEAFIFQNTVEYIANLVLTFTKEAIEE